MEYYCLLTALVWTIIELRRDSCQIQGHCDPLMWNIAWFRIHRPIHIGFIKLNRNNTEIHYGTYGKLGHQCSCTWLGAYDTMMTSSNGNIFRITRPFRGEATDHWWILLTKTSDTERLSFLWSALNQRLIKQSKRRWFKTSSCPLWRQCNDQSIRGQGTGMVIQFWKRSMRSCRVSLDFVCWNQHSIQWRQVLNHHWYGNVLIVATFSSGLNRNKKTF